MLGSCLRALVDRTTNLTWSAATNHKNVDPGTTTSARSPMDAWVCGRRYGSFDTASAIHNCPKSKTTKKCTCLFSPERDTVNQSYVRALYMVVHEKRSALQGVQMSTDTSKLDRFMPTYLAETIMQRLKEATIFKQMFVSMLQNLENTGDIVNL